MNGVAGQAFVELLPEAVGPRRGTLAGLRFAAKDLFDVADRAPTCGLAAPLYRSSGRTAPVIVRLQAAGLVLAGFTTIAALAYEPSGSNPAQRRPDNPLSSDHICGGSGEPTKRIRSKNAGSFTLTFDLMFDTKEV